MMRVDAESVEKNMSRWWLPNFQLVFDQQCCVCSSASLSHPLLIVTDWLEHKLKAYFSWMLGCAAAINYGAAKARWNQSSLSPTELNRHASSCDQIKMTGKTIGSLNMGLFRYSTSAPFKWSWIRFPSVSKILSSPLSQRQSDHFPFSTERQLATMRDKTWSDLFISSFMLVLA